jgi:hypothetical protein
MRDATKGRSPIIPSDASVPLEDASFLRAVLEAIPAFVVRLDDCHAVPIEEGDGRRSLCILATERGGSGTTAAVFFPIAVDTHATASRVEVHLAADGSAAVEAIDAGLSPDVILLDH